MFQSSTIGVLVGGFWGWEVIAKDIQERRAARFPRGQRQACRADHVTARLWTNYNAIISPPAKMIVVCVERLLTLLHKLSFLARLEQ